MTVHRLQPSACPVNGITVAGLEFDDVALTLAVRTAHALSATQRETLCACLREKLPQVAGITVHEPETVAVADLPRVVGECWPQLLAELDPALAGLLRLAAPEVDGAARRLTVRVDTAGRLAMLQQRHADRLLGRLLGRLTGHTLACTFALGGDFSAQREQDLAAVRAQEEAAAAARRAAYERHCHRCIIGSEIEGEPQRLPADLRTVEGTFVIAAGRAAQYRNVIVGDGSRLVHTFDLDTCSVGVAVKLFTGRGVDLAPLLPDGTPVMVRGRLLFDEFAQEVVLEANAVNRWQEPVRDDDHPVKRVELHAHTQLSLRDALTPVDGLIERAARWGHRAIAVTDHGSVQCFPKAYKAAKKAGIKLIFGLEGYLLADPQPVVTNLPAGDDRDFAQFTGALLDLCTTGPDPLRHAVSGYTLWPVRKGKPGKPVVRAWQPDAAAAELADLWERLTDAPVAAGGGVNTAAFLRAARPDRALNPFIDLDLLARHLLPGWQPAAGTVAELFVLLQEQARGRGLQTVAELNRLTPPAPDARGGAAAHDDGGMLAECAADTPRGPGLHHVILLARNELGLRNLYTLVSRSYTETFYRVPRLLRSTLAQHRDGLLLGSACEKGEVIRALLANASAADLQATARFYDYLEMQPVGNNRFMLGTKPGFHTDDDLHALNRRVWELGEQAGRMTVATSDVHFLDPQDAYFRRVLQVGLGFADAEREVPLHLRTTAEMLAEFPWLEADAAQAAVIDHPQRIAALCDSVQPIPDGFYSPRLPGAADELRRLAGAGLQQFGGDDPPAAVRERMEYELGKIIGNQFADLYLMAQKLVKKSNDDGYLVGSRGSVGSSFVAYLCGITEVNPLAPHYRCPRCHHFEFSTLAAVGPDLPLRACPACGKTEIRDGYNIPFETFVGFEGDKTPDIDLNFAGEYQPQAHQYIIAMLGKENVFRAGTVLTLKEKNAIGYARKFAEKTGRSFGRAEDRRLARGLVGVKSANGQHPGGLVLVPASEDINRFTPVNFPGESTGGEKALTTHFDYHVMENQLVKLDILGHDMPSTMRLLQDYTGIDPLSIPLDDPATLRLFSSVRSLKVKRADIGCTLGVLGLPEFGTSFVRRMLEATKPKTIVELLLISGLSHGTDVWSGNAERFIKEGKASLREVIALRDDIMLYLQQAGLPARHAFQIMERVRKGKKLETKDMQAMREHGVPEWYLESCNLIKYMFPKAHAVAYTLMALRCAYFKVYQPAAFYAAYFTTKLTEYDALIGSGAAAVAEKLAEFQRREKDRALERLTQKEEKLLVLLEVARECYARGLQFLPVHLQHSPVAKFAIEEGKLRQPLMAIGGLGEKVARRIIAERERQELRTIRELRDRCGVNSAQVEALRAAGALAGMPEDGQLTLF